MSPGELILRFMSMHQSMKPLTFIQWQVLLTVADHPGESLVNLIADGLLEGKQSAFGVRLKRLGVGRDDRPGLGLISQCQHEKDKRYRRLYVTDKGQKLIDAKCRELLS